MYQKPRLNNQPLFILRQANYIINQKIQNMGQFPEKTQSFKVE